MSSSLYVLECERGRIYVGRSKVVSHRILQHMSAEGSAWTRAYPPVKVLKVIPRADRFDEDKYVKMYMATHGIDRVRGGSYSSMELSPAVRDVLERELRGAQDRCFGCGERGHFVGQCRQQRAHSPPPSESDEEEEEAEVWSEEEDDWSSEEEECWYREGDGEGEGD